MNTGLVFISFSSSLTGYGPRASKNSVNKSKNSTGIIKNKTEKTNMASDGYYTSAIEKLKDSESFVMWKFQIKIYFKSEDLMDVVDGTVKYEDLTTQKEKTSWQLKDAKAQRCIVSTVDKSVLVHVMTLNSSKEMFEKLCTVFEKDNEQQKCVLLQKFHTFTFNTGQDVMTNISELQNIAVKLEALKEKISESMLIARILSVLPDQYKYFTSAWESTSAGDKTLANLVSRLVLEEQKGKSEHVEKPACAFKTDFLKKCFVCGSTNHLAKFCKKKMFCSICKKTNHVDSDCYFRNKKEYKPKKCRICNKGNHLEKDCSVKREKSSPFSSHSFFVSNDISKKKQLFEFVMDSGSSCHMTNEMSILKRINEYDSEIKVAKDKETMKAEAIGDVETDIVVLKDTLYVPNLTKNLLSVNQITENNGKVIFSKEKVIVKKNNQTVLEGKKQNGLYIVNIANEKYNVKEINPKKSFWCTENVLNEWHRKLGHISMSKLKQLVDLSEGIPVKLSDCKISMVDCSVCLKSKQKRLPFNSVRAKAKRPLEIVHTDVCGPIDTPTHDGMHYYVSFLDDFTHFTQVYLMKSKSEVMNYLKEYVRETEAFFNLKTHKIRCDNGGEYSDKEMKGWCMARGIIIEHTAPYSPQLNGKAERLNRSLMEKARALLFDSALNKEMWGEAVCTAAYLLNRTPTSTLEVTPYEKWKNRKPDLSNVQIFGSKAYAKNLGYLKKLDSRSKEYVFVGYAPHGYRLWDKEKRKIVVRRDVVFSTTQTKTSENVAEPDTQILLQHFQDRTVQDEIGNNNEVQQNDQIEENKQVEEVQRNDTRYNLRKKPDLKVPSRFNDYDMTYSTMLTYDEAVSGNEKGKWIQAIEEEKHSLEKNETWELVNENEAVGRKILSSRWVFKVKDDGRYKARLVVRGCEQKYNFNYEETFSPVASDVAIRVLLSLSVQENMKVRKFDIKTAFLNGTLNEEIFMKLPEGYNEKGKVCRLKKALYGLKQAPLKWNERLKSFLEEIGFQSLKSDACIFINKKKSLYLCIYVDDGLLFGKDETELDECMQKLGHEFDMNWTKDVKSFLGIELNWIQNGLMLSQPTYVEKLLTTYNMDECKTVSTPMTEGTTESVDSNEKPKFPFRELVGSLLYVSGKTRPDISFAVNYSSRHLENPTKENISIVKRTLRYLKGTHEKCITYVKGSNTKKLVAFSDADFGNDKETRKSTSGYVVCFNGGPVAWSSRKQPIVAMSTTEAEYIAAADCCKELVYLKMLLEELGHESEVELKVDNQSSIRLMKSDIINKRSKHIDIKYHFIRDCVQKKIVNVEYCQSDKNIADIFTKPLVKEKFEKHRDVLVS